jgi:hypothetical protein
MWTQLIISCGTTDACAEGGAGAVRQAGRDGKAIEVIKLSTMWTPMVADMNTSTPSIPACIICYSPHDQGCMWMRCDTREKGGMVECRAIVTVAQGGEAKHDAGRAGQLEVASTFFTPVKIQMTTSHFPHPACIMYHCLAGIGMHVHEFQQKEGKGLS